MQTSTRIKSTFLTGSLLLGGCFLAGCTAVLNNAQNSAQAALQTLPGELMRSGVVLDMKTGKAITPDQLREQLANYPRVIVGEKHDNPYHHQIELWLVQQLGKKRPQGSVLLEMINPNQQEKVNKVKSWLQSNPIVREERIQNLLAWQQGWPWKWYGDLVMELMRAPYPLLAANLDRSEVEQAYRNHDVEDKNSLVSDEVKKLIEATISHSHGGKIEPQLLSGMTKIQQMRDQRMAEQLMKAPSPALLFAGGYHAVKTMGVPQHVKKIAPNEKIAVFVIAEEGVSLDNEYADFVWFTPKVSENITQ
ncbi:MULTISPECIES: ChaN family lipoprotein [Xenorhabdus]|uniref:ChaN family lipoprotein n=1 Tax=Xenorhabdus TaxID=626 RepID=UPI00064A6661|nr:MULTISPECIES: ChaN family lipoprotein [Xenorhabdus]KLU16330.1 iron-regulated protein [Xenorhabdus griffiniae]KOP32386.1 iron-regulated protein [Xenorhabdus sp. GDc328]WFQ80260.1 ChaN family lipoprotein [Xenorhabdus sp. SF857]